METSGENTSLETLVRNSTLGFGTPGYYKGLRVHIDLTQPQGRWELLVLALLLAARVSESVAETTFELLREQGLLEYPRVLRQELPDVAQAHEILTVEYRAVIDRGRKVAALFHNAGWLAHHYNGDLHELYLRHFVQQTAQLPTAQKQRQRKAVPAGELLRTLRELHQINTKAHWICRVMAEAELWPNLPPQATTYYDRHVRCALFRLGLIPEATNPRGTHHEAETVVDTLFAGDAIPLYRLGRFLCLPSNLNLCRTQCQLYEKCVYRQHLHACTLPSE